MLYIYLVLNSVFISICHFKAVQDDAIAVQEDLDAEKEEEEDQDADLDKIEDRIDKIDHRIDKIRDKPRNPGTKKLSANTYVLFINFHFLLSFGKMSRKK